MTQKDIQPEVIYFLGIGGIGMSAIARYYHAQGKAVLGYDRTRTPLTTELELEGMDVHYDDTVLEIPQLVKLTPREKVLVVYTPAIPRESAELNWFMDNGFTLMKRSQVLGLITRHSKTIAVAGTHGKTTTTSLVASVLAEAGMDPTFVIGGRLNSAGANAKLGSGDHIVVEADESDASFLNLTPVMAVVTNIDADHMDTYGHDFERLKGAFIEFLHRMPFYGAAILCIDDPALRSILPQVSRPITTYGLDNGAQVRAHEVRADGSRMRFRVTRRNGV